MSNYVNSTVVLIFIFLNIQNDGNTRRCEFRIKHRFYIYFLIGKSSKPSLPTLEDCNLPIPPIITSGRNSRASSQCESPYKKSIPSPQRKRSILVILH